MIISKSVDLPDPEILVIATFSPFKISKLISFNTNSSLFGYLNRWNDSMGTELEKPAQNSANKILSRNGWNIGKHQY